MLLKLELAPRVPRLQYGGWRAWGFLKRNTATNLKIHPLFNGSESNNGLQSKPIYNEKTEGCLAISR